MRVSLYQPKVGNQLIPKKSITSNPPLTPPPPPPTKGSSAVNKKYIIYVSCETISKQHED